MTKKTKTRSRKTKPQPVNTTVPQCAAPAPYSARAMGLAEMAIRLASGKRPQPPKGGISPLESIALAIDGALRFDNAMAENRGIEKGSQEARAAADSETLNGIVARVQYQMLNAKTPAETMTISKHDGLTLARYLEGHGFRGFKRQLSTDEEQRWVVRSAPNGEMHASREAV